MAIFRFSAKPNKAHLINWHLWNKETFDKALKENKPIFLSLTATWCHWCHVMDETSFSHLPSIKFLNKNFLAIRADSDKRPDIQERYIMGGWPSNVFLTDEGDIISGTTYIPPEEFYQLLQKIYNEWQQNKKDIINAARFHQKEILKAVTPKKPSTPNIDNLNDILEEYEAAFDEKFGGFGHAMKFTAPLTLELFMREAQIRKNTKLMNVATITLDNMASGEIYDHEWGGFFRYATQRDWSQPHYEKILAENGQIIMNYLHAYEITKKPLYRIIASKSLKYINKYLANHPMGGFFGSQDADKAFYRFKAARRMIKKMPLIDKTIYTHANAQMISTYLEAYRILNERKFFDFALDTMRFLLTNNLSSLGAAHYYSKEEGANVFGLLIDQVWMLIALVDLYEYDSQNSYLTQANDIVDILINRLRDNGSFYDIVKSKNNIGNLKIRYKPVKENALLAITLKRLAILTNNKDFIDLAKGILSALPYKSIEGDFFSMAPYGLALSEIFTEEGKKAA